MRIHERRESLFERHVMIAVGEHGEFGAHGIAVQIKDDVRAGDAEFGLPI